MTAAKRKEISSKILEDRQQADENKNQKQKAIDNIGTNINSDKTNREEFLSLNSEISSLQNEYLQLTGQPKYNIPTSTVNYYGSYSQVDAPSLWNAASLQAGNIFYVPNVSDSSKLTLDVINEKDSDGTTNIEPIIPSIYSSFNTDGTATSPYEYTNAEALIWSIYGYNNGYTSTTFVDSTRGTTNIGRFISGFSISGGNGVSTSYGTSTISNYSIFSVDDIVYANNNSVYSIYKVVASSVSSGPPYTHYVTLKLLTTPATITYPFDFTKALASSSNEAKALILVAANEWKANLTSELGQINNNTRKNANVVNSINQITKALSAVNTWLALSDANKYLSANLTTLYNAAIARRDFITVRAEQISDYLRNSNIFPNRNTVIKLRLKKRSGTLNDVYRAIISVNNMDGMVLTSSDSKVYYEPKLTVQKGLTDGDNTKFFYVKTSDGLLKNDIVYINDDYGTEMKTKIVSINDATMEDPDNKEDIGSNPIAVKQITLENKYPAVYTKTNNVRIMKDLEENEELFVTSIVGNWGGVSLIDVPDSTNVYKSAFASNDNWYPYTDGYFQGYNLSPVGNGFYSSLSLDDISGNGNASTMYNGTVCSTTVSGGVIYVEKTRTRCRRARMSRDGDVEGGDDYEQKYREAQGIEVTIKGIERNGSSSYERSVGAITMPNILWYHEVWNTKKDGKYRVMFSVGPSSGGPRFSIVREPSSYNLGFRFYNGSTVLSTYSRNFFRGSEDVTDENLIVDIVVNWTYNSITIYRNGNLFQTVNMPNAIKPTSNIWYFGNVEELGSETYSLGKFYDRMIFNRTPTAQEIKDFSDTHTIPSGNCTVSASNNKLILTSLKSSSYSLSIQHPNLPINGNTIRIKMVYDKDLVAVRYYNGTSLVSMTPFVTDAEDYCYYQSSNVSSTNTSLILFFSYGSSSVSANKAPAISSIYIGNGNYATTYKDVSSFYNHGNVKNVIPINKSIAFVPPSYIEIPYSVTLAPTDQITIFFAAYSINWSALPACSLISKTHGGGYNFNTIDKSKNLTFTINIDGTYRMISYPLGYITKGWHYFTGTYDGQNVKMYIDGNLIGNISAAGTIHYSTNNSLLIGAEVGSGNQPDGSYYFIGKIKSIKIYNMAATQDEIKTIIKNL